MISNWPDWLLWAIVASPIGLIALVSMGIRSIIRGQLLPRPTVEFLAAERDARLKELAQDRDFWKLAHAKSEENLLRTNSQMDKLISQQQLTIEVLQALKEGVSDR